MIPLPDCLDGARWSRASKPNLPGTSTDHLWLTKSDHVPIIARPSSAGNARVEAIAAIVQTGNVGVESVIRCGQMGHKP